MICVFRRAVRLVLAGCVLLLCLLLTPSGARAIEYGHLKVLPEPNPPEIRCGEPGDDPILGIDTLNRQPLGSVDEPSSDTARVHPIRNIYGIIVKMLHVRNGMIEWILPDGMSKQK